MTTPAESPPLVSVILPTFNRAKFLRPTVTSVFAQSFRDWELIIADDGSNEETRAYLRTLEAPPRVRLIWLTHTGRPAVVRNAALRAAQGKYLAFIDSDDVWLPQKLELQLASLQRHPNTRWSYTRFVLVDEAGNPTPWARRTGGWPAPTGWILERLVRTETVIALPTVVVCRDLLGELGAFDEELVMCEDTELWLRLAAHCEVHAIDQPLTHVVRHGEHYGTAIQSFDDCRRVIEKVMRSGYAAHLTSALRRQRAEVAAGLARSYAAGGDRSLCIRALVASATYSWKYPQWWLGASQAVARAMVPAGVRRVIHGYRSRRRSAARAALS